MLTDIEIAQSVKLKDIREIAKTLSLTEKELILYGEHIAKIKYDVIKEKIKGNQKSKFVLVTAITPTPFGEGKTTVSIGLSMGFWKTGKKSVVALREPSLGPVFGVKGGATGGGYSQVLPMEDINLHFTGDFHAVSSAHNLLSAMLDASIFHGNPLNINPAEVLWPRTIDMNDRALRKIVIGINASKNGPLREDSFVITPASEIMAILGLSKDYEDLKKRIGNILLGFNTKKEPVFARDIKAEGAMAALLKNAIMPNLVQTTENTPAIIHTGPFGNIAHGTCSLTAIEFALAFSDVAVVEAGFGSDLGAEKFLNIVVPTLGRAPDACVLVATVRALKFHGGLKKNQLTEENLSALEKGFENLKAHINILKNTFNLPCVVAVNRFTQDTEKEINLLCTLIEKENIPYAVFEGHIKGGEGAKALAEKVLETFEKEDNSKYKPVYDNTKTLFEKIELVAKKVYGADGVEYSRKAKKTLELCENLGFSNFFICTAKTQYSLSDNSRLKGWPRGFVIKVDDVRIKSGAGFIVPLCGDILEMPGLPKEPAAWKVDIDNTGNIKGLF
jgi:formate--tetrahydrofolate ligase